MIGFETIGNATVTVFDNNPVLTTDTWINGSPYFGSWSHKYEIPKEQLENIKKSKYVWLSHGHPDHIDPNSFEIFKDKIILISDHFGSRIYNHLSKSFQCKKLRNNEWLAISKNIRIKSFADWNQDSSLLIEINKKTILFNLNDGSALGWSKEIKKIISNYDKRFLMKLINWGDSDMINFYNNHGVFIPPAAAKKKHCGVSYNYHMKKWNCNYAIPFSSFHKYSRKDSIKMNEFVTPTSEHYVGFNNKKGELLPAFIQWDVEKNSFVKINPKENFDKISSPEDFGDNWRDNLDQSDKKLIENYFKKFDHIKRKFGFLSFKIGKTEFNIKFSDKKEGISFSCPRNSFIIAIQHNIFDDLLIGNFMKINLINVPSLYPEFTPYIAKYGDNGFAKTDEELKKYFEYYKFNSANYWVDFLKMKSEAIIRSKLRKHKKIYSLSRYIKRKLF